jgi:thioredoxin
VAEPLNVDGESFAQEVRAAKGLVLVDFWSPTCPHCRQLNPELDKAAEDGAGRAKFVKVSVDDAMPLFGEHGVTAVPTLVLFRDGTEIARREGAQTADEILSWLDEQA